MSGESEAQGKLLPLPFFFCITEISAQNSTKLGGFFNASAQYQWERTSVNHNTSVLAVGALLYMVKSFLR
jgi:hypothetical protein